MPGTGAYGSGSFRGVHLLGLAMVLTRLRCASAPTLLYGG